MWKLFKRKVRIKRLGKYTLSVGNEIRWHKDKTKREMMSGVIKWYSWKDKQIEINGDDGKTYLMEFIKDPETGTWGYTVSDEITPSGDR